MSFRRKNAVHKLLMFPLTAIALIFAIFIVTTDVLEHTDLIYWALKTVDDTFGVVTADELIIPGGVVLLAVVLDVVSIQRTKRMMQLAVFTDEILDRSRQSPLDS